MKKLLFTILLVSATCSIFAQNDFIVLIDQKDTIKWVKDIVITDKSVPQMKYVQGSYKKAIPVHKVASYSINGKVVSMNGTDVITSLPIDSSTNKITYSEVVRADSLKSSELYSMGREWFAKTYKSSTNVMQMEDKENGKLIGKALMLVYHKAMGINYESGYINYTISLYVKDGRYKYEITDFYHTAQLSQAEDFGPCESMINTTKKSMGISYQKMFNYYLKQMNENTLSLIADLKKHMSTKVIGKKSEW